MAVVSQFPRNCDKSCVTRLAVKFLLVGANPFRKPLRGDQRNLVIPCSRDWSFFAFRNQMVSTRGSPASEWPVMLAQSAYGLRMGNRIEPGSKNSDQFLLMIETEPRNRKEGDTLWVYQFVPLQSSRRRTSWSGRTSYNENAIPSGVVSGLSRWNRKGLLPPVRPSASLGWACA